MHPEGGHPARPGVREVADGIFLYTTRTGDTSEGGPGPTFVYEVESARADRMGVSFGIDFSASTNITMLPLVAEPVPTPDTATATATATVTAVAMAAAPGPARNTDMAHQEEHLKSEEMEAKTCMERRDAKSHRDKRETSTADDKTTTTGDSENGGKDGVSRDGVGVLNPMSARVSAEAFCRTLVAKIAIRNPRVRSAIKPSCSWELLKPPERSPSTVKNGENSTQLDRDSHTASIRRQLHLAQSLALAGDYDDGVRRGASDRVEEIVKRCRIHGVLYVDQDFPPTNSSLGPSLAVSGLVTWRRPTKFSGAATTAFGGYGPPRPSDVRPCAFAMDASLACALAALAERPHLISAALCGRVEEVVPLAATSGGIQGATCCGRAGSGRDFGEGLRSESCGPRRRSSGSENKKEGRKSRKRCIATAVAAHASTAASQAGMFSARLCVDGIWEEYILDDFFPCLSSNSDGFPGGGRRSSRSMRCGGRGFGEARGPCLSRAHGRGMWVSMLEKAYARAVGSYSDALGGFCLSPRGEGLEGTAVGLGVVATSAAGAVARPAKLLGVFTGAPVLQVDLSGTRGKAGEEQTVSLAEGDYEADGDQATNELWERIVSWVRQGWLVCLSTAAPVLKEHKEARLHSGGGVGVEKGWWKDGLRLGHAYTVLQTADSGNGHRLVQIRGPLPAKEGWRGKWAEDSPLWAMVPTALMSVRAAMAEADAAASWKKCPRNAVEHPYEEQQQRQFSTRGNTEDGGAFWVSIDEAVSAFVEVGVCMTPRHPSTVSGSLIGGRHHQQSQRKPGWCGVPTQEVRRRVVFRRGEDSGRQRGRGESASGEGGSKTPTGCKQEEHDCGEEGGALSWMPFQVYALSVYETSSMFFSMYQKKVEGVTARPYRDIGVTVLRVGDGCSPEVVASTGNPAQAVVSAGAVLTPGRYVVIPSHTGCLTVGDGSGKTQSQAGGMNKHRLEKSDEDPHPRTNVVLPGVTEEDRLPPEMADKDKKQILSGESCRSVWRSEPKAGKAIAWRKRQEGEDDQEEESGASPFDRRDVLAGLMAMFDGLDTDCDGVLCREELDAFLRVTEGLPLQDDVFAWLVRSFSACPQPRETSHGTCAIGNTRALRQQQAGGQRQRRHQRRGQRASDGIDSGSNVALNSGLCLTRHGFVEMYRYIWKAGGRDLEVILRDLRLAGCITDTSPSEAARRLLLNEDRFSVVLTVHSDTRGFDFVAQPPDRELLEAAVLLPVERWGYVSPLDISSREARPNCSDEKCITGVGLNIHDQGQRGMGFDPDDDDRNRKRDSSTLRAARLAIDNADGDANVETNKGNNSHNDTGGDARDNDRIVSSDTSNNGKYNQSDGSTQYRRMGLSLSVRIGPKGAEKAVTFALRSLHTSKTGRNGCMLFTARLDCSGSVNASPLPGSIGLSREVSTRYEESGMSGMVEVKGYKSGGEQSDPLLLPLRSIRWSAQQATLRPGQSKVIQHLIPADPQKPWSWRYTLAASYKTSSSCSVVSFNRRGSGGSDDAKGQGS